MIDTVKLQEQFSAVQTDRWNLNDEVLALKVELEDKNAEIARLHDQIITLKSAASR